jgi:hypothetical protein
MVIETWFLFLSLFLPRLALLIAYCGGTIPANTMPFIGDLLLAFFIPRALIVFYIYENLGTSSPWFTAHIVALLLAIVLAVLRGNSKD